MGKNRKDISRKVKKELKDVKAEVRKCYGAYDVLQQQLHHINGTINEIQSLFEEVRICFNDLFEEWKKVIEKIKK